jgi:hypothetical protein
MAPNWVQKQMVFIKQQPQRFRQRAMGLVAIGALMAGASMAANNRPTIVHPALTMPVASMTAASVSAEAATASMNRTVVVRGRILNEKGLPLAGATVLRKGSNQVTSTDANGNYSLTVPADGRATLQYGYGGYTEQEMNSAQAGTAPVTLQPRATKKHWLFF